MMKILLGRIEKRLTLLTASLWKIATFLLYGLLLYVAITVTIEERATISRYAFRLLLFVLAVPWPVWICVVGGIVWAYSSWRNRQRQQAIIELLLEIRERLR